MKKLVIILTALALLMFAEYRFIMCNLHPYYAEDGFLCIEFMGQTDSYYAEPIFEEDDSEEATPHMFEGLHDNSWRKSLSER